MNKGSLTIEVCNSLGNRLACLLSAWVAAEHMKCRLNLIWRNSPNAGIHCNFSDLFSSFPREVLNIIESNEAQTKGYPAIDGISKRHRESIEAGENLFFSGYTVLAYDGLPEYSFWERFSTLFRILPVNPEVLAYMQNNDSPYVAVHVRFTDHYPAFAFSPESLYIKAVRIIRKEKPGLRILVCGDTPHFIEILNREAARSSGDLCAALTIRPSDRSTKEGAQIALADLLMISGADLILGSSFSTFAIMASRYSNKKFFNLAIAPFTRRAFMQRRIWKLCTPNPSLFYRLLTRLVCSRVYQRFTPAVGVDANLLRGIVRSIF